MTVPENDALKLEIYTDEDIVRCTTHRVNAEAWRGLLSPEEYIERERVLASTPLSRKHRDLTIREKFPAGYEWVGLKYFVLKDTRLPNTSKTSQIVSSCETLNDWVTVSIPRVILVKTKRVKSKDPGFNTV